MAKTKREKSELTLDERRAEYVREHEQPAVAEMFRHHPGIRSAMFLVAQYWNDGATDEMHRDLIFSADETPDPKKYNRWRDDEEEHEKEWDGREEKSEHYAHGGDGWDRNGDAISLFSCFCEEGSQESDGLDSYSPYVVFRRIVGKDEAELRRQALPMTEEGKKARAVLKDWIEERGVSNEFTIEIVGKMLRPHLDGVRPEWDES